MDGDWCEERPTLIDSYGWALNPECFYLNLPTYYSLLSDFLIFLIHQKEKQEHPSQYVAWKATEDKRAAKNDLRNDME